MILRKITGKTLSVLNLTVASTPRCANQPPLDDAFNQSQFLARFSIRPGSEMGSKTKTIVLSLIGGLGLVLAGSSSAQSLTNLYNFQALGTVPTNYTGANPEGLVLSGNTFFGTALVGGSSSNGTIFAVNTDGTGFRLLHSFSATFGTHATNTDGASPNGGLVLVGNTLFGTSRGGGTSGNGTVYSVTTNGTGFATLHNFAAVSVSSPFTNVDGANPQAGLAFSSNTLYGTAQFGGKFGKGVVFGVNTDGTGFTNLHSFTATTSVFGIGNINSDGANPQGALVLSSNTLYGTAYFGGSSGIGTIFAIDINGSNFLTLHSFTRARNPSLINIDGANPNSVLLLSGTNLYGTASSGGGSDEGTVYKLNSNGSGFTTLHSFSGTFPSTPAFPDSDGGTPVGGLVLSSNALFGMTQYGGLTNSTFSGSGTAFTINTDGTGFATVYRFTQISTNSPATNSDGAFPFGGLLLTGDAIYGATGGGGNAGAGTIFTFPVSIQPAPIIVSIYADFRTATIQTANMTITPGAYFTYNSVVGGSWGIAAQSFGFTGTFSVPTSGSYLLTVEHQTSAGTGCAGGGYSPVDILINDNTIASNFDPAQQNGGSLAEVTNSWMITATAGVNTLQWTADRLCSRYWIQGIQITPVQAISPTLQVSAASNAITLFWETNSTGFVLESATNLSGVWSPVSTPPFVSGGLNFVTNKIAGPLELFRLHSP